MLTTAKDSLNKVEDIFRHLSKELVKIQSTLDHHDMGTIAGNLNRMLASMEEIVATLEHPSKEGGNYNPSLNDGSLAQLVEQ